MAALAADRGLVSATLPLTRMLLLLNPGDAQRSGLELYLRELQDKRSPNYHRWLTPQSFGEQFGPTNDEVAAISRWLESQGLTVDTVAAGRRWIEFSGTAAQVEQAFHTELHQFMYRGSEFYANTTELQVPAELASSIAGLVSLNGASSRSAHTTPVPATDLSQANPQAAGIAVAAPAHPLTPQDFASLYNLEPLYQAGFDGNGESIAIVARSNLRLSDVTAFRQAFGLAVNQPQVILNGTDPGRNEEEAEALLDATWAGAVAPKAAVSVIVSASTEATDGVDLSIAYAVDHASTHVISASYVTCEAYLTSAHQQFYEVAWQQAAAEGISVVAAAGDSGAAACEDAGSPVTTGLSVNGLASTAYNTAVGGTSFQSAAQTEPRQASGTSRPESGWTEAETGFHAGGGGLSTQYLKPAWQADEVSAGSSGGDAQYRALPDLALAASAQDASFSGYAAYFQDAAPEASNPTLVHYAGTSASTAAFAGIMALVDQFTGSAQGLANPHLYGLAKLGGVFHDVTTGDNQLSCEPGTPDCPVSGKLGYAAAAGYDLATGLGSLDAHAMAENWGAVPNVGSAAATMTVTTSSITPTYGSPFSATATLTYTGTTAPTGTVAFTVDTIAQGTATLSTTGGVTTATLAIPTPDVGTHNIGASYAGDVNFASTTAPPVTVVVAKGISAISITASPAVLSAGIPETFTAVVTPASGSSSANFTGNVVFFDGTTPLGTPVALTGNQAVSAPITLDATVPHAITAVYYGSGNWLGSTSPQLTLKSTTVSSTVSLQVSSPVVLAGSIVTLTATISGTSTSVPTGTVIFYDGSTPLGQVKVTTNLGATTAAYFTSLLTIGTHSITAAYQGDTNFLASTSPAVTVSIQGYSITPNVTSLTLTRGQSGGVIYTLASGGGLSAAVQFSCAPPASAQMTCAFNPSSLSGSGQTVLTISTTAASTARLNDRLWGTGGIVACLLLACSSSAGRGRRLWARHLLAIALVVSAVAMMNGCGNSVKANPNNPSPSLGTPLGVQTLTITTATTINGSTATQRTYLAVNVQ